MTNKPTWEGMSLKEKILYRVDFLSDHWTKGDDKIPFQFGGWREEVAEDIIKILNQEKDKALAEQRKELIEKILKIPPMWEEDEHEYLMKEITDLIKQD